MQQNTENDRAITALFERMCAAWTAGDAEAYGSCFTEDADYVGYDGIRAKRGPMVAAHDRLFRGVLANSALVGTVESIRYPRHDVAVVHATGSVLMPWRSRLPKRRLSRQTMVAVKDGDRWRFTAFQNSRVRPVRVPEPDSFPARASRRLGSLARALGRGHRTNPSRQAVHR
jgi:uncharacterized protein (TIGR02246 family)